MSQSHIEGVGDLEKGVTYVVWIYMQILWFSKDLAKGLMGT